MFFVSTPGLTRKAFTLIELLVVIAIIGLLMSILVPALGRARKQARAVACQAQLKQWAIVFSTYVTENDGYFLSGLLNDSSDRAGAGIWWLKALQPLYKEKKLLLCPEAVRHRQTSPGLIARDYFDAWITPVDGKYFKTEDADVIVQGSSFLMGSLGPNGWICNPPARIGGTVLTQLWGRSPIKYHWRSPNVKGTSDIPVFLDCMWVDAWPKDSDTPSAEEVWRIDLVGQDEMRRFCVNRHYGAVNVLFMDGSVRRVGLKGLWTLKWHREYDTCGPWTKCGGAERGDWPVWMQNFTEY